MVFQANMTGNMPDGVCSTSVAPSSNSTDADSNAEEYVCWFCQFRSCSKMSLLCHVREEHREYLFATCKTCEQFFPPDDITEHVIRCKGPYACSLCRSTFADPSYLQRHITRKHSTTVRLHCDVCSRTFSSNHSLTIHKRTHDGHMPYICVICKMQFVQQNHLQLHLDSHHAYVELTKQDKPFTCTTCGRGFLFASSLQHHKKQHNPTTSKRVHCCQVCGKTFAFRSELERHSNSHSKPKTVLKCTHCPREFSRASLLNNHMLWHQNPSLFTCPYCEKNYKTRTYLQNHISKHETKGGLTSLSVENVSSCLPSDLEAGSLSDDYLIDTDLNEVLLDEAWKPERDGSCLSPNVNLLHAILYDENSESGATVYFDVNGTTSSN